MTRQRHDPTNLPAMIKRLEHRITMLERALRAQRTSIRSGHFSLVDATLTLTDAEDGFGVGTRGTISLQRITIDDDEGYVLQVKRAEGMGGHYAMFVATVDGSQGGEAIFSTVSLQDKLGGDTIVADAQGFRRGMSDPRLQIPWHHYPDDMKSSTSGTFADVGRFTWYAYHPHVSVQVIIQNDASTTSEIIIRDGEGTTLSEYTGAAGANTYADLPTIRREQLVNDSDGVNGNPQFMTVEFRRASGAGTVRAMITDVVGIDLSLFD